MPSWFRKQSPKEEQAAELSSAEPASGLPSDLEIEKKWLQLTRVDPAKFEFFYRKYYDTILIFISGEINNPEVAQELTNEVFSVALDRLDKFQWQGYSFGAWLFQIARNLRLAERREQSQNPEAPWETMQEDVADLNGASADQDKKEDSAVLAYCISKLAPVRRQVFQAHYWSQMKVREVALVLDLSESNVKMHLQRGRVDLRRCLLKNGMERGLSAAKIKMISESSIREEGWSLIGDDHE